MERKLSSSLNRERSGQKRSKEQDCIHKEFHRVEIYGVIYFYKKILSCYAFVNGVSPWEDISTDDPYITKYKKDYSSGKVVNTSVLIVNSKTNKSIENNDMSDWDLHTIVARFIRMNPELIDQGITYMDYSNNPFRGSVHCSVIPYPVQTTKLKRKYEKSLHR